MAWTKLANSTTADADEVHANFVEIRSGNLLPMKLSTTAAQTAGAYDIGSNTKPWRYAYAEGGYYAFGATYRVPEQLYWTPNIVNTSTEYWAPVASGATIEEYAEKGIHMKICVVPNTNFQGVKLYPVCGSTLSLTSVNCSWSANDGYSGTSATKATLFKISALAATNIHIMLDLKISRINPTYYLMVGQGVIAGNTATVGSRPYQFSAFFNVDPAPTLYGFYLNATGGSFISGTSWYIGGSR